MVHQSTGQLGHFLPYLLGRQLRAVFWPTAGEGRAAAVLLSLVTVAYALALGYLLRHHNNLPANAIPKLLAVINVVLFTTALMADFMPTYRAVQRPLPEPLPVSARLNATTAFVLDIVSVRRGLLLLFVLVALAASLTYWRPLGLSLLVWLSASALSFNLRLLLSVRRGRHPLFWLNLLCMGAAAFWLGRELDAAAEPLIAWVAALAVGGPLLLWTVALVLVAPRFSARYMPEPAHATTGSSWLARLSPEWKMYLRKTWPVLLMGAVAKLGLLAVGGYFIAQGKEEGIKMFFYVAFLPVVGFTYVNHNLLGYLWAATANHLERLGLTSRLLWQYLRLAGSVVLVDSLLSTLLLLALYPVRMWPLLGLLPLVMPPLLALGLWGSLEKAKAIRKNFDLSNMRNNVSSLISILTVALVAALYFMPWWWARVALALVVTLSALVPVRRIVSNHGPTRRQLWRRLTHE